MPAKGTAVTYALICALAAVFFGAKLALGGGPGVVIIKSNPAAPFNQAAEVIADRLRRDPLQPEQFTFDLEGDDTNVPRVLAELRRLHPRLVITVGSFATAGAMNEPAAEPLLFSMVLYPRQSGLTSTPNRRVTGASLDIPLVVQFKYLRRLFPQARRVGVLYHSVETGSIIEEARQVAASQGFILIAVTVDEPGRALPALKLLLPQIDVLWTVADSHVFSPQTTSPLILATLRSNIPLFGLSTAHVHAGAVAALTADYADVGMQTAEIALRVLRGEDPAQIQMVTPRKVSLVLNLRSASHLGIQIPPDLLDEAGEVIR